MLFPSEPINAKHITRGVLKNGHFLSAVAALAVKNENLIKSLFITQTYNEEGVYKIRLWRNGRWQTITIDDFIPCQTSGGPLFATLSVPETTELEEPEHAIWL